MTLTLRVDAAAWRAQIESVAAAYSPIVPVIKGNGYGFGRQRLGEIAGRLLDELPDADGMAPTVAIGTVHELDDVADIARPLVLTPLTSGQARLLRDQRPLLTVASAADVDVLHDWRGPVLVKLRSSMQRFGASADDMADVVERARTAGLDVIGAAIHLPLAGTDADRVTEIEGWLPVIESPLADARQLWVSHLAPETHAALAERHRDWRFPMRVGTRLWHGDKAALHLTTDVLLARPIAAGEAAGYHRTPAPSDGTLVVVGAGGAHGVAPLADGRSPFHIARHRVALLEAPHMHTSTLFVPMGDDVPAIGQAVDVQRPLISILADEVVWT